MTFLNDVLQELPLDFDMAEAAPSGSETLRTGKVATDYFEQIPDINGDTNKTEKRTAQSDNNSRDRHRRFNRNWRSKPKHEKPDTDLVCNAFDTKPKSGSKKARGRQNTKSYGIRMSGETPQNTPTDGEESKAVMKSKEVKSKVNKCEKNKTNSEPTGRFFSDSTQGGMENPNKLRPRPGKNKRFNSKQGRFGKFCPENKQVMPHEIEISSPLPTRQLSLNEPQNMYATRTVVSDNTYKPKNKLGNAAHNFHNERRVGETYVKNSQKDLEKASHSSKRFDYSYHGGRSQHSVVANFQAVSRITSSGQSSVQASVLIEQLTEEKYECMVCCEAIKCAKAVWSCTKCFHIFHLYCIKRWARSPVAAIEGKKIFG